MFTVTNTGFYNTDYESAVTTYIADTVADLKHLPGIAKTGVSGGKLYSACAPGSEAYIAEEGITYVLLVSNKWVKKNQPVEKETKTVKKTTKAKAD